MGIFKEMDIEISELYDKILEANLEVTENAIDITIMCLPYTEEIKSELILLDLIRRLYILYMIIQTELNYTDKIENLRTFYKDICN